MLQKYLVPFYVDVIMFRDIRILARNSTEKTYGGESGYESLHALDANLIP